MQVETAVVQPLKDALTEEQWTQHKARLAADSEAHKQAEEAAERERQLAEAEAAQQQAAQEAEAQRQSTLTKVRCTALLLGCMLRVCTSVLSVRCGTDKQTEKESNNLIS